MAYRFEKEDNGEYALVIDGWSDGIAPDPYSGMNRMFSVNLNVPGEVSVGYPITTSTLSGGGSSLGDPIARSTRWFGYGTPGVPSGSPQSYAILDVNGRVWESPSMTGTWTFLSSGNSVTNSSANDGLIYWSGYLFKTRGTAIDYWNNSAWDSTWETGLNSTAKHYMYVGSDNVLYITNGNYIATLALADPSSPTSFDPTNSATYVLTVNKLQLPFNDEAISLAEVGGGNSPRSTLLIGGVANAIYPWDKTSPNFALPIYVGDSYIKNLVSVNQNAFIFTGNQAGRGRIYITNGSQAEEWFKMPDYLFNVNEPYFNFGDAIFHRNNLIFGCFVNSNALAVQNFTQVYAIDIATKAFRSLSDISAASGQANATALLSTQGQSVSGFGYIVGWDDNASTPGIGYAGTTVGTGSATINTDLMPVGSFTIKKSYTNLEFKLRSPLAVGESIIITPIIDGVSATNLSFQPTVTTGSISGVANVTFQGAQWIQFQISMTGTSASSGVRLKELRLR